MKYWATMLITFRNFCYPLIFITFLPCLYIFLYFAPLMAHYNQLPDLYFP